LAAALEKTFETPGPSLLVIPIDYRENNLLTERLGNIACSI
jgi:acetolactate synthase-1/2/3 large subunit